MEFQKTKVTDAKGQLHQALSCSLGRYTLPEVVSVLVLSRLGDWHPDTQEKFLRSRNRQQGEPSVQSLLG